MKILGFIALTQKMMQLTRATDGIVGEAFKEGRNSTSELTADDKKVFQDLFYTQRKIEEWLPRFRRGLRCELCKHFRVMNVTNDDMDYTRCMYEDENEYTDFFSICQNFEPIEE